QDAVPQDAVGQVTHVFGDDVAPALQQRRGTGGLGEGDRGPGAGPDLDVPGQLGRHDVVRAPGRGDEEGDVVEDGLVEVDRGRQPLQLAGVRDVDHRAVRLGEDPGVDPPHDLRLLGGTRVVEVVLEHEAVELGL